MSMQPTTLEELQAIVQTNHSLLPRGGGSKPALSAAVDGAVVLDLSRLAGVIEYEPGEYTFTAYAGSLLREITAVLAEHGQYLPFDPLLVAKGATLGGTVAANTSGSGRYRYGGVRDFILGVRFVDGQGQVIKSGGKVVKNSAGFDLPKFMVGSLGRYGILVDLSFKVFPQPSLYMTLRVTHPSLEAALQTIFRLSAAPFDIDALDLVPLEQAQFILLLRLGGLAQALQGRMERLQQFLQAETQLNAIEIVQDEAALWEAVNSCQWVTEGLSLVKVPIAPKGIPALEAAISPQIPRRYSAGGNVAWLAASDIETLDASLSRLGLAGLVLLGPPGRPFLGVRKGLPLAQRVKQALDPGGKFLGV
jgi:glycolate oxidase FAD binding subunit